MSLIPILSCNRRSSICDPFSMNIWDPFRGFPSAVTLTKTHRSAAGVPMDWKETAEAYVFKADLPGLKKEEVKVEVEEGGILQISGDRSSGKFLRRFRLPENAKVEEIKAAMENGVLTVTVPKEEVKKPQVKAIEISG